MVYIHTPCMYGLTSERVCSICDTYGISRVAYLRHITWRYGFYRGIESDRWRPVSPYRGQALAYLKAAGRASDSTSSLPGVGIQRGEVLPGVLGWEQEVSQAAMQHQPSGEAKSERC
eukprot:1161404-Pelagomonas_calceolata.AAC.8